MATAPELFKMAERIVNLRRQEAAIRRNRIELEQAFASLVDGESNEVPPFASMDPPTQARVLSLMKAEPKRVWRNRDVAHRLSVSQSCSGAAMSRLLQAREVERVRRGHYRLARIQSEEDPELKVIKLKPSSG